MQAILALILLALPTKTYTLHGDKVIDIHYQSCGSAERLLKDTYKIQITGNSAKINYTPWDLIIENDMYILYKSSDKAYTQMYMLFSPRDNTAILELQSITEDRKICADRVSLH